jgi:hypothetical protein
VRHLTRLKLVRNARRWVRPDGFGARDGVLL